MSSTDFINELKELFGDRVWTRNDEDFLTTAKYKWLENENIECVIECEGDYDDLEYYEHYWGTDNFHNLLNKYKRTMEWQTNCIANIYDNSEYEEEESEEEEPYDLVECGYCGEQFSLSKMDFQYLPSKEDEEKEECLGIDLCMPCFCKVEHKYSYVEDIEEE